MIDMLYDFVLHRVSLLLTTIIVFFVSLIQVGFWNYIVKFTKKCIYGHLTALKADELLTESMVNELENVQLEVHNVRTVDGYNLRLQRMYVKGNKPARATNNKVILMQHGLMETSSTWLLHGEESLSVRLLRKGYDVWLGNNRTNFYGQLSVDNHSEGNQTLTLHPDIETEKYWDYCIDQLVKYDFPAMISYIRENTGAEKIDFMGASQGAGQAMASICEHPDMKNMFNTMILSCPAMFIQKEPKQFLLRMLMSVPLASLFGSQEFFMLISVFQLLMPLTWLKGQMGYSFMKLMGFIKRPLGDKGSMKTRARWFQWIPVGCTSVRNLTHWMEVLKTGGALTKLETNTPYKFEDMLKSWDEESKEGGHRPNVMVLLANEDCVIDNKTTKDVFERCYSNCEGTDRGECKVYEAVDYGHIDFIWSEINSTKVIYDKVQKFLLSHN